MKNQYRIKISGLFLISILFLSSGEITVAQNHLKEIGKSDPVSVPDSNLESEHKLALGLRVTYAPGTFTFIGKIERSDFLGLALQFWHSKFSLGNFNLDLGSEILAASRIKFPENGINGPKEKRFGIGLIPAVVQAPLVHNFFLSGSAGIIIFPDNFPDAFGTRLNFVFDFGVGYEFDVSSTNKIQFGYQAQHISNGGTGRSNPGIDFHMFYVGYRF